MFIRKVFRQFILFSVLSVLLCSNVFAASSKTTKLPKNSKKRTYLYKIDENALNLIENGSPSSIQEGVQLLNKPDSNYPENEKVLISVSASIMEIVWPSQKVTWSPFENTEDNPYTGAINSSKNGIFDSSTGNVDFLTTLLPVLVIFSNVKLSPEDYKNCEKAVKASLELRADSVLANYVAGCLYEKLSEYENAEKYLEFAYSKNPEVVEICIEYSKVLRANKKMELAAKVVESISGNSNISDIQVLKQNAYIAFEEKDFDKAEDYVARVLQQVPNDLEFVLFRAKIFIEKKDYIHAVSLLDIYSRQNDSDVEYLILRAKVQLDWSKNTSAATETVEKAMQLYPENTNVLMLAAKISSVIDAPVGGKYADELAELVLSKESGNADALTYALDGLIQRENWQNAYEISRQLISIKSDDSEIISRHVTVCIMLGKKTEALDYATKAYNANKTDETLLEAYVYAYCQSSSRDSSLQLVNSLMNNSSSKVKSYLYYRRSYLQRTEDLILADLRSSLISNPRNSDALFRLYEIYYGKKDYRKAQYYLRQVVAIKPNDSSVKKLNDALTQLIQ